MFIVFPSGRGLLTWKLVGLGIIPTRKRVEYRLRHTLEERDGYTHPIKLATHSQIAPSVRY
jgi:hypothetical protein